MKAKKKMKEEKMGTAAVSSKAECSGALLDTAARQKIRVLESGETGSGNSPVNRNVTIPPVSQSINAPNPQVKRRRYFTASYKARIVKAADNCKRGEIGALLRNEGLYWSQLILWRKQLEEGGMPALTDNKRGRPVIHDPLELENDALRRRVERLEKRLNQANTIIEFQKKFAEVLGISLNSAEDETKI